MDYRSRLFLSHARASPVGDADRHRPTGSISQQGLLAQTPERRRLKKSAGKQQIRLATLNIGTLKGRYRELAAMLKARRIDIAAIQETRWKGAKAYNIGEGYKLFYVGTSNDRNGVGLAVAEPYCNAIAEVQRFSDRLMKVVLITETRRLHLFSGYAPQTGCTNAQKEEFWTLLDDKTAEVPPEDIVIVAGDLNGHVGSDSDGYRCHGGRGYGTRNADGERILDYAEAHGLRLINTFFAKPAAHLRTYYSGGKDSQIDFVLTRCRDFRLALDAKIIPSESIGPQHRPLVVTMSIELPREKRDDRNNAARVKWWKLKEQTADVIANIDLPPIHAANTAWAALANSVRTVASETLGATKPGRRRIDRLTWLWTDEVQEKVRQKKKQYQQFLAAKTPENWKVYKEAWSAAKTAVASARSAHFESLYQKLDTREGEKEIYRLARSRHQKTLDIEKFYGVNDENGRLITDKKLAAERWRSYFETISNEEFPHPPISPTAPVQGPVLPIQRYEVADAIGKMKCGKATGPDDIPADLWKVKNWPAAVDWLHQLFNRIVEDGQTPADWQQSITVPIWKQKGSPAECANYRPIRLLSHTMKIFERIIDSRIRTIVQLSVNQCGFVKRCGTIDAIHAARLLFERHREKAKQLHTAFLDLEKAFDRVPHSLIWYSLRKRSVPEEL
uniref:Reverse transcriptase domain-containing protein n=1 Tax=Plectus sambesii TaxID=2011161 RepID=A0A914WXY9_9BILA